MHTCLDRKMKGKRERMEKKERGGRMEGRKGERERRRD